MPTFIDTVVIGAGQAGLATSYYLQRRGCEHVVLERAELAGDAWRNGVSARMPSSSHRQSRDGADWTLRAMRFEVL